MVGGLLFVVLGTFYWSLWEIPWLPGSSRTPSKDDGTTEVNFTTESKPPLRPQPLDCSQGNQLMVVPEKRFCSWKTTLQDCYEMLMPIFHKQQSWVFLGDTGMANIPFFLSVQWPFGNLTIHTKRNPCQNLIYMGLPPPEGGWKQPNPDKGEGPIGRGKERPYCMDCTNCWNVKLASSPANGFFVEYLVVEYARDVSLPSQVTRTTQETTALYLGHKDNPPSVCVASAGLNDAAITPPISEALYIQNLDKYLGLLQRTCEFVIWISLHAVVESEGVLQSNCRLHQWHNASMGLLAKRDYENVYIIDIWDKSFHTDYDDATTLGQRFYASFARLFKLLMAGPEWSTSD